MELTTEILSLRPYLFSIAYNMLGIVEDAEDIVQDAFEKWISVKEAKVPKAYLGRMVVNQCIDRTGELKRQRESYTGTWLPEPYITMEADPAPTLEYGLLFLLERLNPVERAVFILRESFSDDYSSIAEVMNLSADNCRQLLHRAHEKLGRTKTVTVDAAKQRALTEAFLFALQQQDRTALDELLRSDVELFSDGGGKRAAAIKPLFGLDKVLKFLFGVVQITEQAGEEFDYRPECVNGRPAALLFARATGELDSMQYVEHDENGIARLLFVRNPEKLRVRAALG
jgi:RNA polymerase sigma-70 factor (ECF subfamily)